MSETANENGNDSFDLDLSISTLDIAKKNENKENDEDVTEKGPTFVPKKGQKAATNRLTKISSK